jgi:hypothetical protein
MSITGVIERLVLAMEEVRVAGVELVMTTDGVVAHDLMMIGVVGVVSVGADGVVVSLGLQSSKLY